MSIHGVSVWWPVAGIAVALVVAGFVAWLVQEWAPREDIEGQRPAGWPAARFAVSANLRAPVKTRQVNKSRQRRLRRHGGARP